MSSNTAVTAFEPITPYGLDVPFNMFSLGRHAGLKIRSIGAAGDACIKEFEVPVAIHSHVVVRKLADQYGKTTFSIPNDVRDFVKQVESVVFATLEPLVLRAEPLSKIGEATMKHALWENLVSLRLTRCAVFHPDGSIAIAKDVPLKLGDKFVMTFEVYGIYHSAARKGLLIRPVNMRSVE